MKRTSRGFTLIELLVVIAIIGILAGIVIVSLTSAQDRAQRTSTVSTLRSVIPEILVCSTQSGTANVVNSGGTPVAGNPICYSSAVGTEAYTNAPDWPTLTGGWAYGATSGNGGSGSNNYPVTFTATKANQTTITCTVATSVCS